MTGVSHYLLVLYLAEQRGSPPISPGHVADAVDRSPSATTEMLQRLESDGYLTYEPYDGATLTAEGRATAEELYETYDTLSRFFHDVLGLDEHESEAMELAGAVSPTVVDRLASTLLADGDDPSEDAVRSLSSTQSDPR
ncbi:metal-dependent transcriptional regulator [Natrinema sp. DC36]|uniref:metal-dependent transcriptional regulator n=1 Tax=Natrinema sp. DC36 TaxID=2878680 RepID=UPI001CF0A5D9|nr:metal-dependent transcriptional regulator [Natrinema sp. DC36]